jgi:hypothetical protein
MLEYGTCKFDSGWQHFNTAAYHYESIMDIQQNLIHCSFVGMFSTCNEVLIYNHSGISLWKTVSTRETDIV